MKIAIAILWAGLAGAAWTQGISQGGGVTDDVRAARDASNKAIAQRNMPAYLATISSDFIITTGNGQSYTRAGFLELWTRLFADKTWEGCNRIVDGIEMSTSQPLAAERGHFVCAQQQQDGREVYTGTYQAMWRKEAGGWKTKSELFVTLACTGSGVCKGPK